MSEKQIYMLKGNLDYAYDIAGIGTDVSREDLTNLIIEAIDKSLAEQKAKVIKLCEIIENNVDRYCSQCDYKKYQAGDNPCWDCEYPLAKQLKEELQG